MTKSKSFSFSEPLNFRSGCGIFSRFSFVNTLQKYSFSRSAIILIIIYNLYIIIIYNFATIILPLLSYNPFVPSVPKSGTIDFS